MPNRVIREGILESDKMDLLSWPAEVFYRRLLSIVDDYGCTDARSSILKSKLYPTEKKQSLVSLPDIEKWKRETVEAGLVRCYEVDGKPFLLVINFNQQIRVKRRKFPAPPEFDKHLIADATHTHSTCMLESNPIQSETESETNLNLKRGYQYRVYDLSYFESIGYTNWPISDIMREPMDKFLQYRSKHREHGPITTPEQVEAILRGFSSRGVTDTDAAILLRQAVEKGWKNVVFKKVDDQHNNTAKTYKKL